MDRERFVMVHRQLCVVLLVAGIAAVATYGQNAKDKYRKSPVGYSDTPVLPGQKWRVHDIDRPRPPVVAPGVTAGSPPSDAIVLFDGKDLSKWAKSGGEVGKGYVEVGGGLGGLVTRGRFGDIQLEVGVGFPG